MNESELDALAATYMVEYLRGAWDPNWMQREAYILSMIEERPQAVSLALPLIRDTLPPEDYARYEDLLVLRALAEEDE